MSNNKLWTQDDLSRVQSKVAKDHGGQIPKGHWVTIVQSTVDKRNGS